MGKPIVKGPVDGNAFAIMAAVGTALKKAGQGANVKEYQKKAMSGDYNHLLATSMEYVEFDLGDGDKDDERDEDECTQCDMSQAECTCGE